MYLGIDIGGTKTLVACLNEHGVIKERVKFPTPKQYDVFLREIAKTVANLSTKEFRACGVAMPGKVDRDQGSSIAFGNLPWKQIPLRHDIHRIARCPVVVENDANLAGLSEAMLLKDTYRTVLYITVSTGIGTGFIADQRIVPELADSEGGHMLLEHKGKLQEWEDFASGKAMVRRYGKRAAEITDAKTWRAIAHDLALGIVEMIAIAQPQAIVIGGSVGGYFDRFGDHLRVELEGYQTPLTPTPVLLAAQRPDDAVVYGCYDLAKHTYGSPD